MRKIILTTILLTTALLSQAQSQQIILQLEKDITITQLNTSKTNLLTEVIRPIKQLSQNLNIWLVEIPNSTSDKKQRLITLKNTPQVKAVQFNEKVSYRNNKNTPNDALYEAQWQYNNKGEFQGLTDADIDAPKAWDITTGGLTATGDEIVVAIIDGGIGLNHPDLINNIWTNPSEIPDNHIDDDANGYIDDFYGWNFNESIADVSNDGYGHWHGTPVAGIIGAEGNNSTGVCGVNWQVKIMNILANDSVSSVIAAYDYVLTMRKRYNQSDGMKGAFVVATNASLGINGGQPSDHPLWCAMYNALGEVGILSVGATANAPFDVDVRGDLPTTCTSDFLISVTNTNRRDELESAAFGKTHIDLSAPGSETLTVNNYGDYGNFGGTSAAAPHVAGTIALLYSTPTITFMEAVLEDPAASALLVKDFIIRGTDPVFDLNNKTVSGGRLNVYKSLCNLENYFGSNLCSEDNATTIRTLHVAPNPSTNIVQVAIEQQGSSSLKARLFNAAGQVIQQQFLKKIDSEIHQLTFPVANLQSGIYYLMIHANNEVLSEKILVE